MTEIGADVEELVARALAEDLGTGDVTSEATVPEDARARARIVQKAAGRRLRPRRLVAEAMRQCGVEDVDNLVVEGQWREDVPAEVLLASGTARALLAAERTALNFLGHLSGVATLTARYVEAVAGTGATILDTRKTTPGLRWLEKAAVARRRRDQPPHGPLRRDPDQGEPHRRSPAAWRKRSTRARNAQPEMAIEVECRDLDEAAYALGTGADRLLLDNMDESNPARSGSPPRRELRRPGCGWLPRGNAASWFWTPVSTPRRASSLRHGATNCPGRTRPRDGADALSASPAKSPGRRHPWRCLRLTPSPWTRSPRTQRSGSSSTGRKRCDPTSTSTTTPPICLALDGLPLAIELAAARTAYSARRHSLLDAAVRARRGWRRRRLPATTDAARRHRLEPRLLTDAQRLFFARLGVFAGAFDHRCAAPQVAGCAECGIEVEGAGEHAETGEERALVVRQQFEAPVDGGAQRLLSLRGVDAAFHEELEPVGQSGANGRWAE